MEELEKILVELCEESMHLGPGWHDFGYTFYQLAEKSWERIVARAVTKMIDEGKIQHIHNRYYPHGTRGYRTERAIRAEESG